MVFIYPTWWYGLPAMLKGWLERVMVPGFAFEITASLLGPRPKLRHINRLLVLTTCGASPLLSWVMGQPGRRTLLRGFRSLCSTVCRTKYVALYTWTACPKAGSWHISTASETPLQRLSVDRSETWLDHLLDPGLFH